VLHISDVHVSMGVGNMCLVRLDVSSAIKVEIIVKDRMRDRVMFKISVKAKI